MITLRDLINNGGFIVDTTRSTTLPSGSSDPLCKTYNTFWGSLTYTHMSRDQEGSYYITGSWLDQREFVNNLLCKASWGNTCFKDASGYFSLSDLLSQTGYDATPAVINGQAALRLVPRATTESLNHFANFYFAGDSRIPHPLKELEFRPGTIKRILENNPTPMIFTTALNSASKHADISNLYWVQINLPQGSRVWAGYGGNQPVWLTEDGECPTTPAPIPSSPGPISPQTNPAPEGSPYRLPRSLEGLLAQNGIESGTVCLYFDGQTCKILREKDKRCLAELECTSYKEKTDEQWSDLICQAIQKLKKDEEE